MSNIVSIRLPGNVSLSPFLETVNSVLEGADDAIDTTEVFTMFLARQIMLEELGNFYIGKPEVDFKKLQEMIDSGDNEMFNLAMVWFDENTLYTGRILLAIRQGAKYTLNQIIIAYINNNRTNITNILK